MNVVLLTDVYYPYGSATGICCYNVAEEMARQHTVTVICIRSRIDQTDMEEHEGQKILRVSVRSWNARLRLDEKVRSNHGIKRKWYTLLLDSVRARGYIRMLLSRVSIDLDWVRAYQAALAEIEGPIDVLVPFCFPMEAVVAGMEYVRAHSGVKLIPYLFDPFVDSLTLHRTRWNKHLKRKGNLRIEQDMLKASQKVLCMYHLRNHFVQSGYCLDKLVFTEHPLLKRIPEEVSQRETMKRNTSLVYLGVFDRTVRNPQYLLKLMLIALPRLDGQLHLYVAGNCGKIVSRYCAESNGRIVDHGFVRKEEANRAMYDNEVLVAVANAESTQVSSKIFEYISTGKPIVLFYTDNDDINAGILSKYQLCLCLKQDDVLLQENVEKLINFCRDTEDKRVSFADVEKIYYSATPEYATNQMLSDLGR